MELEFTSSPSWEGGSTVLEFPATKRPPRPARPSQDHDVSVASDRPSAELLQLVPATSPATARPADMPARSTQRVVARNRSELVNRFVNVTIAALALAILSPILALIAVAVKLTSRGPIMYNQIRVGMDRRRRTTTAVFDRRQGNVGGVEFKIYKFRSMRVDAEQASGAVWATKNDPRITSVGRFLRKTRLDEVPQLINVIKGDMNIVGPRPERPSIFAELRQNIEEYPLRQQARPGITGWAQINHAYDASIEDVRTKVRYDLEYLQRQSFVEDIKIMARTLPVMIFNKGAC